MKKKLIIAIMAIIATLCCSFGLTACFGDNGADDGETGHTHSLTLVEENAATCTEEGNIAYYACSGCDKWFEDENGEKEIADKSSVTVAKTEHDYVDKVCSKCGKHQPTEGLEFFDRGKYYEVTGIGTATDTDIVIPEEYNGKPVASVGKRAFEDCNEITSFFIPDSIKYIDWYAFWYCESLTTVSIPDSVEYIGVGAFDNNNLQYNEYGNALYLGNDKNPYLMLVRVKSADITSCTVNENTKFISNIAFYGCTELESVSLPNGLTSMIGWGAFYECNKLNYAEYDNALYLGNDDNPYMVLVKAKDMDITSCTVHGDTKFIYGSSFAGCEALESVTLPDGLISINYGAFHECESLQNVNIPDGVTMLGEGAFYKCKSLTSIVIPDSVKYIEKEYTFGFCSSLTDLTIGNGIDRIARIMFAYCNSLTSVTIPDSVTVIDDLAFEDCTALASVSIPDSVIVIEEYAFSGCSSLENIIIPDGVTFIGNNTFEGCGSLKSVTIPADVTSIGRYAFSGCRSLENIIIPAGVTAIEDSVFNGCSSLKSVTIPAGVTSIGRYAFSGCSSLADINFKGTKEQWEAIEKDSSWDKSAGKYAVHCTDGDIGDGNELKFGVYKLEYAFRGDEIVKDLPYSYVLAIRENGSFTMSYIDESETESIQGTWKLDKDGTVNLLSDGGALCVKFEEGKIIYPVGENAGLVFKYSGEEE